VDQVNFVLLTVKIFLKFYMLRAFTIVLLFGCMNRSLYQLNNGYNKFLELH